MNFKKLSLFIGSFGLACGAISPALATFSFSDFSFYRQAENQTSFHTTEYTNEDGSSAGTGLQAFQQFVHKEASAINLDDLNARKLDANRLTLTEDVSDVKIYFIHEGAGFRNQLKLTTTGATFKEGLVFVDGSQGGGEQQLRKGDYVSVGNIAAGTTLDFALLANGYQNDNFYTYYANVALNPDRLQHVIAYEYQGYLILAWEDLYNGGDKDYNDIVFAIDIGETNLNNIPTEPVTNQAPAAVDDLVTVYRGQSTLIDVMANDSDPEGDTIVLTDVDGSLSDGTVEISGNKVSFTPGNTAIGESDAFTYTITDTSGNTDSATVTVNLSSYPD